MAINLLKSWIQVAAMRIMAKNLHEQIIYSCCIMLLRGDIDLLTTFLSIMIFKYHIFKLRKLIIMDYLIVLPLLLNYYQQMLPDADSDREEYRSMI
jgi:hypothetical protein